MHISVSIHYADGSIFMSQPYACTCDIIWMFYWSVYYTQIPTAHIVLQQQVASTHQRCQCIELNWNKTILMNLKCVNNNDTDASVCIAYVEHVRGSWAQQLCQNKHDRLINKQKLLRVAKASCYASALAIYLKGTSLCITLSASNTCCFLLI